MESWIRWLLISVLPFVALSYFILPFLMSPHESFALLQFKNSFTIDTNYYYYLGYSKTATWKNGTDCCSWLGFTCHHISGHVIGLNLACSGLQGKIHPNSTLFHLSHLQSLNLAFNYFYPSHLPSLIGGFESLTHLNLSHSYFEGEIPSQISHLSKLASLDLSLNEQLKWKEDTWKRLLQNATVLRELVLDGTNMSSIAIRKLNVSSSLVTLSLVDTWLRGKLTREILCLPNLQHLYLTDLQGQLSEMSCSTTSLSILDLKACDFYGSILPSFSNLTDLTFLDLSFTSLNSSIPSSLLTLPHLTFLNLEVNHLSGQIPNVFPQSNGFEELHFSYNNIEGELPLTLSNLQHLILLDLSNNKLSGQIPSSLLGLTQLSDLDCSNNKLQGTLPYKITGFSNLTRLWLPGNLLNGTIPSWCLSLPSLVYLDLSENHFTGHISAISSYSLEFLHLSYNKLQGNIPNTIFSLVNLIELDLSSNNLSGSVHFPLFSKLQNLDYLGLSQNNQLSLNFKFNGNYSFSRLRILGLSSMGLTEFPKLSGKFLILEVLDLSNNKLNGEVPDWLQEMSSLYELYLSQNLLTQSLDQFVRNQLLRYLDLSFNSLTGSISSSICNASSIVILNLSHNKLIGIIPQCLANLSSLGALDLRMNKLHGTLPSTFAKNCRIRTLELNGNHLKGLLPESLSNCTELEVLDLGNNQIEDTFPHWLQSLPYLKVLVLRANKLHGPIANLKTNHGFFLDIFDISSNNFSGPIPKAFIKFFEAMKDVTVYSSWPYMEMSTGSTMFPYIDSVTVTTKQSV